MYKTYVFVILMMAVVLLTSCGVKEESLSLTYNEEFSLSQYMTKDNIEWISENSEIVIVNNDNIKAVNVGDTTVDGFVNNKKVYSLAITVSKRIENCNLTYKTQYAFPNNTEIESSNTEIVGITDGYIRGLAPGTAVIYEKIGDAIVAEYTYNVVLNPIKEIFLSQDSIEVDVDGITTLSYKLFPTDASDYGITWFSSDEEIATVTDKGKVTGLKPGSTTIIASTPDGAIASCKVKVNQKKAYLRLNDDETRIYNQLTRCVNDFKNPESVKITDAWTVLNDEGSTMFGVYIVRISAENGFGGKGSDEYLLLYDMLLQTYFKHKKGEELDLDFSLLNEAISDYVKQ